MKIDCSITRSLTINTGNYESIKPTVTLTVKDVEPSGLGEMYHSMDEVLTGLLKFEIINCSSEGRLVNSGLDEYCKTVVRNSESIGNDIDTALTNIDRY